MDKPTPDFDEQAERIARPIRDRDDARKFTRQILETAHENANCTSRERETTDRPEILDVLAVVTARVVASRDTSDPAFARCEDPEDPEIGERVDIEVPRDRVRPGEEVDVFVTRGDIASALLVVAYLQHCAEQDEAGDDACGCAWDAAMGDSDPSPSCETGGALAVLAPAVRPRPRSGRSTGRQNR